ncbi:hypothetical protein JCM8097_008512 [Rhodosporidiobolus ruineniae]
MPAAAVRRPTTRTEPYPLRQRTAQPTSAVRGPPKSTPPKNKRSTRSSSSPVKAKKVTLDAPIAPCDAVEHYRRFDKPPAHTPAHDPVQVQTTSARSAPPVPPAAAPPLPPSPPLIPFVAATSAQPAIAQATTYRVSHPPAPPQPFYHLAQTPPAPAPEIPPLGSNARPSGAAEWVNNLDIRAVLDCYERVIPTLSPKFRAWICSDEFLALVPAYPPALSIDTSAAPPPAPRPSSPLRHPSIPSTPPSATSPFPPSFIKSGRCASKSISASGRAELNLGPAVKDETLRTRPGVAMDERSATPLGELLALGLES